MLRDDQTVLVIVDVQEKLLAAMHEPRRLVENVVRLARGAAVLELPILWTEQNPRGLGPTVEALRAHLPGEAIEKLAFSCCGEAAFVEALKPLGRSQVLLGGIESHVCVYQTARDLLAAGIEVEVVADAVSSRTEVNRQIGLDKAVRAGAGITSVETALFELLERAEGERFKAMLSIVK